MALYPRPFPEAGGAPAAGGMPWSRTLTPDRSTPGARAPGRGVSVCLGQTNISDAYYPLRPQQMLKVASWLTPPVGPPRKNKEAFYDMITVGSAPAP